MKYNPPDYLALALKAALDKLPDGHDIIVVDVNKLESQEKFITQFATNLPFIQAKTLLQYLVENGMNEGDVAHRPLPPDQPDQP